MLVRAVFDRGAAKTTDARPKHAPDGVASITDQHGGAWISGHRTDYAPYYQLIADAGFTVVSLDYSLGPEHTYPTAVEQLRDAHAYVLANAERLHVDSNRIVLAGNSAGAQLSSQLTAPATNPDYAREVGIESALRPEQLRGVVLNCGIYEVTEMVGGPGIVGWGDKSLWAYTGTRDLANSTAMAQMSTLQRHRGLPAGVHLGRQRGPPERQAVPGDGRETHRPRRTSSTSTPPTA